MRILQVYHIFPALFGGVSTVVYQVTKALCKRGHEVHVLTTNAYFKGEESREADIKIRRFRLISQRLARHNVIIPETKFLSWAKALIKEADCIHIHGYRNLYNTIIHYYAVRYDVPYVLQAHGSILRNDKHKPKLIYDALFGYRLMRGASKVIALSRVEAEQYRSMGVPRDKIVIIPNGIDPSEYADLPPKGAFKKKFNIPEDKKIVLYLGRIHKLKGIDFLIKAYAYLVKKMNFDDAILVIAGPDDGYQKEARELATTLGVFKRTVFTGALTEVEKLSAYVDADVVVNVEPYNVFGLVPLEAAACGKPVIVSKDNAISEIVLKGRFGFALKYGDVKELASKLHEILVNEKVSETLGQQGRAYVLSNFTWKKIINKYEKLYRELR